MGSKIDYQILTWGPCVLKLKITDEFFELLKKESEASVKKELTEFFDNVIVNDEDEALKKNRLELLQMLCKTFDNYFNFSKIESI